MTPPPNRVRYFGADVPFLDWLRNGSGISSHVDGIVASDSDVIIHQYAAKIADAFGLREQKSRDIQAVMGLEVKSRGGSPTESQRDTLWKWHMTSITTKHRKPVDLNGSVIFNFGYSFLQLSSTRPDNSEFLKWGRFDEAGNIFWRPISLPVLLDLLQFRRHPQSFDLQPFRRHHKTQNIWGLERTPLGLVVPVLKVRRS